MDLDIMTMEDITNIVSERFTESENHLNLPKAKSNS